MKNITVVRLVLSALLLSVGLAGAQPFDQSSNQVQEEQEIKQLNAIRTKTRQSAYTIKDIVPSQKGLSAKMTIMTCKDAQEFIIYKTEFPGDYLYFSKGINQTLPFLRFPNGDGSVYRFKGDIQFAGYRFVSTQSNGFTFALLSNTGLTHLVGDGDIFKGDIFVARIRNSVLETDAKVRPPEGVSSKISIENLLGRYSLSMSPEKGYNMGISPAGEINYTDDAGKELTNGTVIHFVNTLSPQTAKSFGIEKAESALTMTRKVDGKPIETKLDFDAIYKFNNKFYLKGNGEVFGYCTIEPTQ